MLQSAQHFDLSEDALSRDNSLKNIWHLLERHAPPTARIRHGPDNPESAVANHLVRLFGLHLRLNVRRLLLLLLLGHCALRLVLETGEFGAA